MITSDKNMYPELRKMKNGHIISYQKFQKYQFRLTEKLLQTGYMFVNHENELS